MDDVSLELEDYFSLPVDEGEVVDGKYALGECIGWGGMGVVFEATHVELDTPVAVKFVREEYATNEEVVCRFLNEARAAARLRDEHIARVLDIGRTPDGVPFMVMERLEGTDLASHVGEHGPLTLEDAAAFVLQAAEGLAEAHARGIVHRDIKPENLFLARTVDGRQVIKILDFGISREVRASGRSLTNPLRGIGSPSYMAPEQMRNGHDADARADIWSLGVVLFQLVTGEQPFKGGTVPEICASVLSDAPRDASSVRPGLPRAIDAVIRRCLHKNRERRYADVHEFAQALAPWTHSDGRACVDRIERIVAGVGNSVPPPRPAAPTSPPAGSPATPALAALVANLRQPGVRSRFFTAMAISALATFSAVTVAERLVAARRDAPTSVVIAPAHAAAQAPRAPVVEPAERAAARRVPPAIASTDAGLALGMLPHPLAPEPAASE